MRRTNYVFMIAAVIVFAALLTFSRGQPPSVDAETYRPAVYATAWALLPPLLAIALALITKEVYSSLLAGAATGALLYANGGLELALNTMLFADGAGLVGKLSDNWNVGIIIFLVILGVMVELMNTTGASNAFGRWASRNVKTHSGAQLATIFLGIMIFIDDYFNCLTVGSVMRPVTDMNRVSRAKLAYLIDATAAPICIIAPVSSWAAAVTSSVPADSGINGFTMFLRTIPYNFYSLCTILMVIMLACRRSDFGPMRLHEDNAERGGLFSASSRPLPSDDTFSETPENTMCADRRENRKLGGIIDLVVPVVILIACCVTGMVYTGGFFEGEPFVKAFGAANASRGLVLGSTVTILLVFVFYMSRGVLTFTEFADCIPSGFKAMVPSIVILSLAWTLSGMTGLLGGKFYIQGLIAGGAAELKMFLPAVIFIVAVFLAFATGTSWGTFAILIPIVCGVFNIGDGDDTMTVISIAACLSGAVCGDHCSPISDTTIMASAGAQCDHVDHVTTQLPYAAAAACVSAAGYAAAGFAGYYFGGGAALLTLPLTLALMFAVLRFFSRPHGGVPGAPHGGISEATH